MSQKSQRIDEVSASVTYIGEAATNATEAAAMWRIRKLETTGTVTKIIWADGNEEYDNVWTDRASLNYS